MHGIVNVNSHVEHVPTRCMSRISYSKKRIIVFIFEYLIRSYRRGRDIIYCCVLHGSSVLMGSVGVGVGVVGVLQRRITHEALLSIAGSI